MERLSLDRIQNHPVPKGAVTLWWLGQAGFFLKSPSGTLLAVDPYLTNSCKAIGEQLGLNFDRLVPPPLEPAELVGIDLYAITHSHGDHLDPETLAGYRAAGGKGPFIAPAETVDRLQELGVPSEQIVMTWPNRSHTIGDVEIHATFAIPLGSDDLTHVGYIVSVKDGPTVYLTGDTGYHEILAVAAAPHKPDVLLAVINGVFRNMGPAEAARLAKELDIKVAIPCHYDLFPDNSLPPQLLHTTLTTEGIGERFRLLEHGAAYTFPES